MSLVVRDRLPSWTRVAPSGLNRTVGSSDRTVRRTALSALREPGFPDVPGAEGGHDGLVRLAANGQRGVPPDQLLLRLREAVEDLVDEHERPGVGGVDQDADGAVAFGQDQRLPPRVARRFGRHDLERDFAVSIDADCPEPEILERHVGELHPPPQLLQLGLAEHAARQVGRQHVDD